MWEKKIEKIMVFNYKNNILNLKNKAFVINSMVGMIRKHSSLKFLLFKNDI